MSRTGTPDGTDQLIVLPLSKTAAEFQTCRRPAAIPNIEEMILANVGLRTQRSDPKEPAA